MINGDLTQNALRYASEKHFSQLRKGGKGIPYIMHPVSVALTLQKYGFDDEVIAAGLLHDTVEDTDATLEDIRNLFGERVNHIVWQVTEPSKDGSLAKVDLYDIDGAAVKAADVINNIYDTYVDWINKGDDCFKIFVHDKKRTLQHYMDMTEKLLEKVPPVMVTELKTTMERIYKMCG